MGARVSLQVERVVESFGTERAEKALDLPVGLEVTLQQFGGVEGQSANRTRH